MGQPFYEATNGTALRLISSSESNWLSTGCANRGGGGTDAGEAEVSEWRPAIAAAADGAGDGDYRR